MTNSTGDPQVPRTQGKVLAFVQIPATVIEHILSLKLTGTQHDLLLYLWTLDPYGDRLEIPSPEAIAPLLNCDTRTISRALRRLGQEGLLDAKHRAIVGEVADV